MRNRYKQAPHLTRDTNGKVTRSQINIKKDKFSFLKEGLPSRKTACAPCMLGKPPNLVIVYTALKPRHIVFPLASFSMASRHALFL